MPSGAGGGGAGGSEAHRVIARPTPQQLRSLPPSGAARLQDVPLELPEALLGADSTLLDRGAAVEFTIRNRNATRDLTLVPVQVVLPPIETERWRVRVDEEDEFVTVSLAGPADALDAIASGTDRAVAVLALSSDDLEAMVTSKDISVFLLRGGVVTPLPAGVQATPSKRSVRFEVQPLPASPGP
ncbi:MAG TPA: hypothetical protein DEB06_05770 [Phycisphaerales bacterium]|nr:hypothetical protein [Phycisphaerales bacterium]